MMSDDEDGGKKHFSLKDMIESDKKESAKKKRKKRKLKEDTVNFNGQCQSCVLLDFFCCFHRPIMVLMISQ